MVAEREFTRRMLQTVLTVTATVIVLALVWTARSALMVIYVSGLIAVGFSPLVRFIERPARSGKHVLPHTVAILAVYLTIVGALVLVGLIVVPPLVEQAGELWAKVPRVFNDFQRFLIRNRIMRRPVSIEEAFQNAPAGSGGNAVNAVFLALWSLIGGVLGLVTILILSFYLLVEAKSMFEYATRFVPVKTRSQFISVSGEIVKKVSAWLSAQFILAGLMGTFAAIGLGLMGIPYFYVIALIAAVGETIPIVGPIVAGITAVAVALTASPKLALMAGVYFLALHQIEANVLVPQIMERRVGVSPVTVIIALLIGGELWGLVGAILAIPTAAILSVIVTELTADASA